MKWHQVWAGLLDRHGATFTTARDRARLAGAAPNVLMATGTAGYPLGSLVESSLGAALTLRGARVDVLMCDGALPACQQSDFGDLHGPAPDGWPQPRCEKCFTQGRACYAPLGLDILRYGDFLDAETRDWARSLASGIDAPRIPSFDLDGVQVGEHAHAGALRYFARGDLAGEPASDPILRRYLEAALLTVRCLERVLDQRRYDVACFHHGIYVPQGLVGEVCRKRGVRVVNWNPAYRDHCFVFSHGDSYHHTMISEPVDVWENLRLPPAVRGELEAYLEGRRMGRGDWIWFHSDDTVRARTTIDEVGLDRSRPIIALLTSVIWDARLHYASNAFDSMVDWIAATVDHFREHPDMQLVIRVHPAEVTGNIPSRQTVKGELAGRYDRLPPNVKVVPPESSLSTYELIESSRAVLVYNTKTAIEIASRGVPVVVAGEAWIRDKGFSMDASSREEYLRLLDALPSVRRLDTATHERALNYAYHFFFRRMIPLSFVRSSQKFRFDLALSSVDDLLPGRDAGLDCICRGILEGTPFVFEPHAGWDMRS